MAKTYGVDLRERVIVVVEGGLSRRSAAERFRVAISTAIRWVRASRQDRWGAVKLKGGDTRSHRIEMFRDAIHARDIALQRSTRWSNWRVAGAQACAAVAPSTVHRFLVRNRITLKESRYTPASRSARTWRIVARSG